MPEELTITVPAVAALRRYIQDFYDGKYTRFARENRLDASEVGKVLSGKATRTTVAFAAKIRDATRGYVGLELWVPITARTP